MTTRQSTNTSGVATAVAPRRRRRPLDNSGFLGDVPILLSIPRWCGTAVSSPPPAGGEVGDQPAESEVQDLGRSAAAPAPAATEGDEARASRDVAIELKPMSDKPADRSSDVPGEASAVASEHDEFDRGPLGPLDGARPATDLADHETDQQQEPDTETGAAAGSVAEFGSGADGPAASAAARRSPLTGMLADKVPHRKIVLWTAFFVLIASGYMFVNRPRKPAPSPVDEDSLHLDITAGDWETVEHFPAGAGPPLIEAPDLGPSLQFSEASAAGPAGPHVVSPLPKLDEESSGLQFHRLRAKGEETYYPHTNTPSESWNLSRNPDGIRTSMRTDGSRATSTLEGITPVIPDGGTHDQRY